MAINGPTGQDVVNRVLTLLQVMDLSGIPSVSDSNVTLDMLNQQWNAWGIDDGLIYSIVFPRFTLVAGKGIYTIGMHAPPDTGVKYPDFTSPRPAKIYRAAMTQAVGNAINANAIYAGGSGYIVGDTGTILGGNGTQAVYQVSTIDVNGSVLTYALLSAGTGYSPRLIADTLTGNGGSGMGLQFTITSVTAGGSNRNELDIINAERYLQHNDLNATALVSDELYPDYGVDQYGFSTLYLYPVPSVLAATDLELHMSVPFTEWTLTDVYQLPDGLLDPLVYGCAYRCLSIFGNIVNPAVAQNIAEVGAKAEERFRAQVRMIRQLSPPPETK